MTKELIERTIKELSAKTIVRFEHVEDKPNPYWVMHFSDGSEASFKFMSEIFDCLPIGR